MAESKRVKVLRRVTDAIRSIEDKDFTMYFFVADSRNTPNASMEYIYQLAKTVSDIGYKVCMVYQLNREYTQEEIDELNQKEEPLDDNRMFIGVREWLGDEYADLPHQNISLGNFAVSPQDFLFIPEAFSALMFQTHQLKTSCKRIAIMQNMDYVTDMIPFGVEWANYGIHDAVATSQLQLSLLRDSFPYVKGKVLPTYIPDYFRKPVKPKNLAVNILSKSQNEVNRVLKTFYWQYPTFRFVPMRPINNASRKKFAEMLQEGSITIWMDSKTAFGNSALEAMRCDNIVIGKVPELIPEWMGDENGLKDNGVWFTNISDVPKILAEVINAWINDDVPQELTDAMAETNKQYTYEQWLANVKDYVDTIIKERIEELKTVQSMKEHPEEEKNNKENSTEE